MNPEPSQDRPRRDDLSSPAKGPLSERERRYRTLFGAMDEGFVVVEMVFNATGHPVDYLFLEFNDAFTRMTGITAEAALAGRSARDLYPTLEEFWFETYGRVATTGEAVRFENGAEAMGRWFEVHAFRIGGPESREVGILFKDVSERRKGEIERERLFAEARAREAFLSLITDRLPVRVGYLGSDYRYRYLNGQYERAFGVLPGKGVGMSVAELAGDEAFQIAKPFLDRALSGDTHTQEFSVPYTFGERRVEVQYVADRDEEGRISGVVVHVLDVTNRHEAERKVAEERARQDRTLENAEVATFDWDVANDRVYANPLLARFFGVSEADAHGGSIRSYFSAIHAEDREATVAKIQASLASGGRYETEYRVTGGEGRERSVLARGDTTLDANGQPLRLSGVVLDITDRLQAQTSLQRSEDRLRVALRGGRMGTWNVDLLSGEMTCSETCKANYGRRPADPFTYADLAGTVLEEDRPRWSRVVGDAIERAEDFEVEYRVHWPNGTLHWVQVRGSCLADETGKVAALSGVSFETTDRVLAEEERGRLLERLATGQETLDTVLTLSPSFVNIQRGEELRFEYANPAYRRLLGDRPLIGRTLAEAMPEVVKGGSLGQEYDVLLREVMATGEPKSFSRQTVRLQAASDADVEERILDFVYQPLRDGEGRVTGVLTHGHDVTERARAERNVAEREELFRTVFEGAVDDAIVVMDADRTVTAWNPAAERITGWSAWEMAGRSADGIFTVEDCAALTPADEVARAARLAKAEDGRWYLRRDGTRFWGSGTTNSLHDADGNVRGYLKVFRDATERYEETQALAFLSLLTEAIIDERDADQILVTTERMLGRYIGASRVVFAEVASDGESFMIRQEWAPNRPGLIGSHLFEEFGPVVGAELRGGRTHVSRDAFAESGSEGGREAIRRYGIGSGVSVPVMVEGRLASVIVVHGEGPRDWTDDEIGLVRQVADRMSAEIERARAEEALRASEGRFRQLIDLSPSTVWTAEPGGGLTYISQNFYEATGMTPETALPNGWASTIHPEDLARVVLEWDAAREEETLYDTEFRIRNRLGEYRWISARALPIRDGEGRVTGWLGSNSDIQAQKETEETLMAMVDARTEELQRTVREAEGFNYSISHDLRTPLRAMVSTASILLEELGPELDEEHRGLLVRQAENAKRMGRLIDELLRLSRLARVEVNRESLDMTEKALSVFEELSQHDATNGCRIEVQLGMTAEGDEGLVRTVLQNLLGNACKFSPDGGAVRVREEEGAFAVSDEGVGFDMAFAPKVFLPFERLVSEAEFPGTGIGLANVKRIVERHKGRVWVESAPGEGTTFWFTLAAE